MFLIKKELGRVRKAMLDYLIPKHMLTNISYFNDEDQDESNTLHLKPKYKNFNLKIVDEYLILTYDADVDINIEDGRTLSLLFEDDESFFSFIVKTLNINKNTIIFFSAVLSVVVRKKTIDSNSNLKKYLEYGSLIIILLLGLVLLFT